MKVDVEVKKPLMAGFWWEREMGINQTRTPIRLFLRMRNIGAHNPNMQSQGPTVGYKPKGPHIRTTVGRYPTETQKWPRSV